MKQNLLPLFLVFLLAACSDEGGQRRPEGFKPEVMLGMTPVKDQGTSDFCWIHAMLATVETERLMQGDSVNLSAHFLARRWLEEEAMRRFRDNGAHGITMRGMAPMALDMMRRYGMVTHDSYSPRRAINFPTLCLQLERIVDMSLQKRLAPEECLAQVNRRLDDAMGSLPRSVFMYGCRYTFLEFAHSVCRRDEYRALTSRADREYGRQVELDFPDNHYNCRALNIPPDSLVRCIERSLRGGHPVAWEGGRNDDHAVAIVGMGRDRRGREFFVAKNSWGEKNATCGLLYLLRDYAARHTAVAVLPEE